MAGFYLHIPFCRKVCYYCDFHFVASLKHKDSLIKAICEELTLRSNNWNSFCFDTVYFGGGTPTVLPVDDLSLLIKTIYELYHVDKVNEFTIEANPDDLSRSYLKELKQNTPVNRISIGVQSFIDRDLALLNRRHNAALAVESIKAAKDSGFENITIDLMYGIPGMTPDDWKRNLDTFLGLGLPHLSAYHLSIEPKTVFGVWKKKGKFNVVDEETSQEQYQYLIKTLSDAGYEHYEISNFSLKGHHSKHNTSYWKNIPYIGIGPSAHSYDGKTRRWNLSNNTLYTKLIEQDDSGFFEEEVLTIDDRFNDYILTSLRTSWGIHFEIIVKEYGQKYLEHVLRTAKKYSSSQLLQSDNAIRINEKAWLVSDSILADFMYT